MNKEQLLLLYQNHSQTQISNILHISRRKVQRLMVKYEIPARSYAKASSFMNTQRTIIFNEEQEQLIYGSLIGDACLYDGVMKSNKTGITIHISKLIFSHTIKQLPYLKHKKSIIGGCKIGDRTSGFGAQMKYFAFSHTPSLIPVCQICLTDGKKQITQVWLDKVKPLGLAYWYMDDGYYIKSMSHIGFCTNSYSDEELDLLQNLLLRFGLQTRRQKASKARRSDHNRFTLVSRHFDEAKKFIHLIRPYIIPHFNYKLC